MPVPERSEAGPPARQGTASPSRRSRRSGRWLTLMVLGSCSAAAATIAIADPPVAAVDERPNIVLVTADDMALGDLRWMPHTRRLVAAAGVRATQFLSNHPVCCPARAQILTGQHAQNNGVHHNAGPWGGEPALSDPSEHIGAWLGRAGYRTAFVGKYLNVWDRAPYTPPGWSRFNPLAGDVYAPFDFSLWRDGDPRQYSGTHTSDVMGEVTQRYIRSFSRAGAPFFIWTSQVAPHSMRVDGRWGPPRPAVRHRGLYADVEPPTLSDPSYDEQDVSDKPAYVQAGVAMSSEKVATWHRARIRSLLSVDEQVKGIIDTLRRVGELDNTYVVFTSDNGYLLGEHRMAGKNMPYEEALRVPLAVRGPGIPARTVRKQVFSLVDLAPTFLRVAGAQAGSVLDGRSMLATWRRGAPGYDHYLIQAGADDAQWWWRGVRSKAFTYSRYGDGFEELYDMRADPHQLLNVAGDPAYDDQLARARARLAALGDCAGSACWSGDVATGQSP